MKLRPLVDWLTYFAVRTAICVVQAARMETCVFWANVLAWFAYDVIRLRRAVIDDNLRHAFPEWDDARRQDVARRMWGHLLLLVCETAHAPRKIHDTTWRDHVALHGARRLVEQLLSRRATVLVSGHFGNFEMAGFVAGLLGVPTYAVARPLDNPYLHEYVSRFRGSTGQFLLPKEGSALQIEAVLRSGGALALLADQHAGPKGCWAPFFGRPASCHKALAIFTLTNDAPMLVCYARRAGGPLQFDVGLAEAFDPRLAPPAMQGVGPVTAWYSQVLEREVRQAPEQYWWIHRRWREPPPPRKQRKQQPPAAA